MTSPTGAPHRRLLGLRTKPGRLALGFMRMPLNAYRHEQGQLLGRSFIEFEHVGRKSGTTYQAVAMVLRYDDTTGEAVICRGWDTDWFRNLKAHPATHVTLGRASFTPEQRFLTEEEAFGVAVQFRRDHPHRMRLISRILDWGDLRDDAEVRRFVHDHPFVAFRPASGG